jgi:hypothetical protein
MVLRRLGGVMFCSRLHEPHGMVPVEVFLVLTQ